MINFSPNTKLIIPSLWSLADLVLDGTDQSFHLVWIEFLANPENKTTKMNEGVIVTKLILCDTLSLSTCILLPTGTCTTQEQVNIKELLIQIKYCHPILTLSSASVVWLAWLQSMVISCTFSSSSCRVTYYKRQRLSHNSFKNFFCTLIGMVILP